MAVRTGFTLDAGVLIAYGRGARHAAEVVQRAVSRRRRITVPAAVLAQVWRGPRQQWLSQLLVDAIVEPLDGTLACRAGELMARTATSDVVDASVAVSAAQRGDTVFTTDPDDLQRLADDLGSIRIVAV